MKYNRAIKRTEPVDVLLADSFKVADWIIDSSAMGGRRRVLVDGRGPVGKLGGVWACRSIFMATINSIRNDSQTQDDVTRIC